VYSGSIQEGKSSASESPRKTSTIRWTNGLEGLLFYPIGFLMRIPDLAKSVLKVYLVLLLFSLKEGF
jgi:hypothetical protein